MNLRLLLSDLEADWVYFPWRIEPKTYNFDGSFLVAGCGSSIYTQGILLSLVAYNHISKKAIPIYYYNIDHTELLPTVQHLINNNEIVLYTPRECPFVSFCIVDSGHNLEDSQYYTNFFQMLNIKDCKKAIFISDYKRYAPTTSIISLSEQEVQGQVQTDVTTYYQKQETMFSLLAEKFQLQSTYILRVGEVLGAFDSDSTIQSLIHDICKKETLSLHLDQKRYPTLYIGDYLRAVFWCCNTKGTGSYLYNLAESNQTTFKTVACLCTINQPHAKLTLSEHPTPTLGITLSTDKLMLAGWAPIVPSQDYILYTFAYYREPLKCFTYSDYYDDKKLNIIQSLLLDMLKEIDIICKKYDIQYFLAGGTLLGAVRNHGFIPWDNDLDLMMTREHYNRFIQVAKTDLPDHLYLQAEQADSENHFYSKIRLNETLLVTPFNAKFSQLHNGIFLDIFPQDKTVKNKIGQKIHINAVIIARSMVFNKWGNTAISGDGRHPIARSFFTLIKNLLPMYLLEKFQYKLIRLFENKKDSRYLYDGMGQNIKRGAFPACWLEKSKDIIFENQIFPSPEYTHEYLKYLYGSDYQYPVPLIKRKSEHNIQHTDLGPYVEYLYEEI